MSNVGWGKVADGRQGIAQSSNDPIGLSEAYQSPAVPAGHWRAFGRS